MSYFDTANAVLQVHFLHLVCSCTGMCGTFPDREARASIRLSPIIEADMPGFIVSYKTLLDTLSRNKLRYSGMQHPKIYFGKFSLFVCSPNSTHHEWATATL